MSQTLNNQDLISIVSKYQERTGCEDLDHLEQIGGEEALLSGIQVFDFKNGLDENQEHPRRDSYGANKFQIHEPRPQVKLLELASSALTGYFMKSIVIWSLIWLVAIIILDSENVSQKWYSPVGYTVAGLIYTTVQVFVIKYRANRKAEFEDKVDGQRHNVQCLTMKNGQLHKTFKEDLVVGDTVVIEEGIKVPADLFLVENNSIYCEESIQSGRMIPIKKSTLAEALAEREKLKQEDHDEHSPSSYKFRKAGSPILLTGSHVLKGQGLGVVISVGDNSSLGRMAHVQNPQNLDLESTLADQVATFAVRSGKLALMISFFTFGVLMIRFLFERIMTSSISDWSQYPEIVEYIIIWKLLSRIGVPEGLGSMIWSTLIQSSKNAISKGIIYTNTNSVERMSQIRNVCVGIKTLMGDSPLRMKAFWANNKSMDLDSKVQGSMDAKTITLLQEAFICNNMAHKQSPKNSIDYALLDYARAVKLGEGIDDCPKLKFELMHPVGSPQKNGVSSSDSKHLLFSSSRRRMSTIIDDRDQLKKRLHMKGAAEDILRACSHMYDLFNSAYVELDSDTRSRIIEEIESMGSKGYRVLALAFRNLETDEDLNAKDADGIYEIETKQEFIFIGLVGLEYTFDSGHICNTVVNCRDNGIKWRLVSGESRSTARAIAEKCGFIQPNDPDNQVIEGEVFHQKVGGISIQDLEAFEKNNSFGRNLMKVEDHHKIYNTSEFENIYKNEVVLARARPQDKATMIMGLEEHGPSAMIGASIGDRFAMSKATVGLVSADAPGILKGMANIILLHYSFEGILMVVELGHYLYDMSRKFIQFFTITSNVLLFVSLFGALLVGEPVIAPAGLLWAFTLIDDLSIICIASEKPKDEPGDRIPIQKTTNIVTKGMKKYARIQTVFQVILILIVLVSADVWVPEYINLKGKPGTKNDYYSPSGHMRSGRGYEVFSLEEDFRKVSQVVGPSRHYSFILAIIGVMEVMNLMASRLALKEWNIMKGIRRNLFFANVTNVMILAHNVIVTLGGRLFGISPHGLAVLQWVVCNVISASLLVLRLVYSILTKPEDPGYKKLDEKVMLNETSRITIPDSSDRSTYA